MLPQPYYRWDGTRHNHDVALLALDRAMPQQPAALAEQRPDTGKQLLIAGYGSSRRTTRREPVGAQGGADRRGRSGLVPSRLARRSIRPGSSAARPRPIPAMPGGTACYGDSGGPAFAYENTGREPRRRGRHQLRISRRLRVLALLPRARLERARLHRSRARHPAAGWAKLRDDPPMATIRATRRHVGQTGVLTLRVDDDMQSPLARRDRVLHGTPASASRTPSAASRRTAGCSSTSQPGRRALLGLRLRAGRRSPAARRTSCPKRAAPPAPPVSLHRCPRTLSAREEPVAESGLGDDQRRVARILLDPPSQLRDLHAQVVSRGGVGVAPHLGHDRAVCQQAAGVAQEAREQRELRPRQRARPRRARSRCARPGRAGSGRARASSTRPAHRRRARRGGAPRARAPAARARRTASET